MDACTLLLFCDAIMHFCSLFSLRYFEVQTERMLFSNFEHVEWPPCSVNGNICFVGHAFVVEIFSVLVTQESLNFGVREFSYNLGSFDDLHLEATDLNENVSTLCLSTMLI